MSASSREGPLPEDSTHHVLCLPLASKIWPVSRHLHSLSASSSAEHIAPSAPSSGQTTSVVPVSCSLPVLYTLPLVCVSPDPRSDRVSVIHTPSFHPSADSFQSPSKVQRDDRNRLHVAFVYLQNTILSASFSGVTTTGGFLASCSDSSPFLKSHFP